MHPVGWYSRFACRLRIWSGLQGRRERRARGAAILMYHGVLPRTPDPLLDAYAIDAATFRGHLRYLLRRHEVVPLRRLVGRLSEGGEVPANWVAITLDDALENQVLTAAPILKEESVPWALAVPAGLIGTGRSIWTCEFRLLLLECWRFASVPWPHGNGDGIPTRSPAEKRKAVGRLLPHLFEAVDEEGRAGYLERLIDRVGRDEFLGRLSDDRRFSLASWAQLERIRSSGVELLSHGMYHRPQNRTLSRGALTEEITASRRLMGERLGELPSGFALPHGARSEQTDELVRAAGYSFCLSSRPGRVVPGIHSGNVPRFAAEYPLAVLRRHLLQP